MSAAKKKKNRKKINKTRKRKGGRKTLSAVKEAVSNVGKGFTDGSDRVAGLLLDEGGRAEGSKGRKVKEETIAVTKDIAAGVKKSFEDLKPRDFLYDAFFEIGKFVRIAKDGCARIFKDLME